MNKGIMTKVGFEEEMEMVEGGRCPFCDQLIKLGDFRNDLSRVEYEISGLCQKCQDETYA